MTRPQRSQNATTRPATVDNDWSALGPAARRMREGAIGDTSYGANVVPLDRLRVPDSAVAAPQIKFASDDRPAPPRNDEADGRLALVLFASLLAHVGLYAALSYQPIPTASIAEEAITIEIVVGANSAAGTASAPSNAEAERQASTETRQQNTTEAREETRPEQDTAAARDMLTPQEPDHTVEPTPQDLAAVTPTEEPIAPVRQETQPPERKVEEPPPEPKPEDRPLPKPSTASAPAANSVGRGRMAGDANYQGLVAARLARFKRFPPEARSRRQQGKAIVSFNINGDGRVTSVKLVRGTGFPALDHEVEAMVRRASPFPAPPGGVAVSFSAPVSFHLN